MPYLPRIVDAELRRRLSANGAVLIEGPKACGKTQTARQQAGSEVLLDIDPQARQAGEVDPSLLLDGATPRLIDEWQIAPAIWDHVRREVDRRGEPGQFVLTGSATPADDSTRHTGAGRFGRVRMRPMTLFELGRGTGEVSLASIMAGERSRSGDPGVSVKQLAEDVVRGGWPALRGLEIEDAAQSVRDYLEIISRTDVQSVDGVRRDPERVRRVLRSLARHVSTQVTLRTIAGDASGTGGTIADDTVGEYLGALSRLLIVEDQPSWNTHLRSSNQLRSAPTRHFVDPSLAVAALRSSPGALIADLNTYGLLFESLVIRDLRVYAQGLGADVFHYRDRSDLEVDAIVDSGEQWAAFEVKLGVGQIEQAAANLRTFASRIDVKRRGEPQALGVIVGTGYGYVRPDGVHVIPIGALGP